ncbi:uncharacterized protein BDZ99DRAFT_461300, partial [Mytilinidion resinicola]
MPQIRREVMTRDANGNVAFSTMPVNIPTRPFNAPPFTTPFVSPFSTAPPPGGPVSGIAFCHLVISPDEPSKPIAEFFNPDAHKGLAVEASNLVQAGCTGMSHVDIPPQSGWKVSRTEGYEYGVVLEGEVLLKLTSGDSRALN